MTPTPPPPHQPGQGLSPAHTEGDIPSQPSVPFGHSKISAGLKSLHAAARKRVGIARPRIVEYIRSHCPGTAEYSGRYEERIVAAALKRRQRLLVLHDVGLSDRKELRTQLRYYQNQLAAMEVWEGTIVAVSAFVVLAFTLIMIATKFGVLFPSDAMRNGPRDMRPGLEKVGDALALSSLLILGIGLLLVNRRIPRKQEYFRTFDGWSLMFWFAIAIWVIFFLSLGAPRVLGPELWPGLLYLFRLLGLLLLPLLVIGVTAGVLFRRRRGTICPDAVIANELLQMLSVLKSEYDWRDLATRSRLLKPLEDAATCVEFGLPRRFRNGDPVSDLWLQQHSIQIAAALRELKQWIAMPQKDTRTVLLDRIKANLVSITMGNWDELPRTDPKQLSRRVRAAVLVRDLVLALLPFSALLLVQKWNPTMFERSTLTWLFAGCFVWAVSRLLAMLDPRFSAESFRYFGDVLQSWARAARHLK